MHGALSHHQSGSDSLIVAFELIHPFPNRSITIKKRPTTWKRTIIVTGRDAAVVLKNVSRDLNHLSESSNTILFISVFHVDYTSLQMEHPR